MRILLAGGASGGSATPVIAVAEALARRWSDARFLYVGTRAGPERALVEAAGLPYAWVAMGRLRRYLTWWNLVDPVLVAAGVAQASVLVRRFRPDLAFGAGGFATVPPLLAARLGGAAVAIHQQDVLPGLANRMLAPFAARLTVALPESVGLFQRRQARAVGNPVRSAVWAGDASRGRSGLQLDPVAPVVLAVGGGTGAVRLNQLVVEAARQLVTDAEVVHLTGTGKAIGGWSHSRYHPLEFITEDMPHVLAAADVVVTRAGMSTLAELAALRKPAILVPLPHSPQEANGLLVERRGAAVVRPESALTPQGLVAEVRALLADADRRRSLGETMEALLPAGAAERVCDELEQVMGERNP